MPFDLWRMKWRPYAYNVLESVDAIETAGVTSYESPSSECFSGGNANMFVASQLAIDDDTKVADRLRTLQNLSSDGVAEISERLSAS